MSLLFDENLSHVLPGLLADVYPGSIHVQDIGRLATDDDTIWWEAKARRLAIISQDKHMWNKAIFRGHPPKVIWVRTTDTSTLALEALLRRGAPTVLAFLADPDRSFLTLA